MTDQPKPARRASRYLAGLTAVLHIGGRDHSCRAQNLSRSGVLLGGDLPTSSDGSPSVTLASSAGDLELTAVGRISRIAEDPRCGDNLVGIEFVDLPDADRQVLEALVSRVVEGLAPASLEGLPPGAPAQQVRDALSQISIPHRIALATRGKSREREFLMNDSNPQVLDALARNPSLNVAELRALLRIRILLPATLQALARDARWTGVEELRVYIAAHPNTPIAVAERLVATLSPDGLRRIIRLPGLNPTLRMKLGARVKGLH